MSLNDEQRARTRDELRVNLQLSGATHEKVRAELDLSPQQFEDALDVGPDARPQDVWLLRDLLDELVRAEGGTPAPYSVLTPRARLAAAVRFPALRRARRR